VSRSYDAIIIGGGIIGLSLAIELRKHLSQVAIFDKGAIGREASFAAAGMLNADDCDAPPVLAALAKQSARLYPAFIGEVESGSDARIEFSRLGAVVIDGWNVGEQLSQHELSKLEPGLQAPEHEAVIVQEDFVEPRSLMLALEEHARRKGVEIYPGDAVLRIVINGDKAVGVHATSGDYPAAVVVNCAGAWAKDIAGLSIPTKPVKGQMIAVENIAGVRHVIRCSDPEVYMLPRMSGALAIGATVEDRGFDTSLDAESLQILRKGAELLLPSLKNAGTVESWAGVRPGTPDKLPILGGTPICGYFVATGHYRSGILLAPITAKVMTQLITSGKCEYDLSAFALCRFG
jgi:glycine oxidase